MDDSAFFTRERFFHLGSACAKPIDSVFFRNPGPCTARFTRCQNAGCSLRVPVMTQQREQADRKDKLELTNDRVHARLICVVKILDLRSRQEPAYAAMNEVI